MTNQNKPELHPNIALDPYGRPSVRKEVADRIRAYNVAAGRAYADGLANGTIRPYKAERRRSRYRRP